MENKSGKSIILERLAKQGFGVVYNGPGIGKSQTAKIIDDIGRPVKRVVDDRPYKRLADLFELGAYTYTGNVIVASTNHPDLYMKDTELAKRFDKRTLVQRMTDYVGITSPGKRKIKEMDSKIEKIVNEKKELARKLEQDPINNSIKNRFDSVENEYNHLIRSRRVEVTREFLSNGYKKLKLLGTAKKAAHAAVDFMYAHFGENTGKRDKIKAKITDYFLESFRKGYENEREKRDALEEVQSRIKRTIGEYKTEISRNSQRIQRSIWLGQEEKDELEYLRKYERTLQKELRSFEKDQSSVLSIDIACCRKLLFYRIAESILKD